MCIGYILVYSMHGSWLRTGRLKPILTHLTRGARKIHAARERCARSAKTGRDSPELLLPNIRSSFRLPLLDDKLSVFQALEQSIRLVAGVFRGSI